ncbi:MAG: hypothetical protein Q8Q14_01900 [Gemmatimonadales bacterium]|nr:hypothetical protein [Gemmatimonadales bacterium]
MTATLQVLFDSNGDGTPETDITAYIRNGPDGDALHWKRGMSTTSQDYVSGTCEITVFDPDGDWSPENPLGALRTVVENYEAGTDTNKDLNATTQTWLGQGFNLAAANEIDKIALRLALTGAPGGSLKLEIWHTSGGVPTAIFEATAVSRSVATAGISTFPTYEWVDFTFEVPPLVGAGTVYAIVLKGTGGYTYSAGNTISWATSTDGYADSTFMIADGSAVWSTVATDAKFRMSRNDIRDGRMVWIGATVGGTSYPAWTGVLRSVTVHADRTLNTAYLVFSDYDDDAKNRKVRLKSRASFKFEDAFNELWTDAGGLGLTSTQVSIGEEEEGLNVWYQQPHDDASSVADKLADAIAGRTYWKAVSAANGYKRVVMRSSVADRVESSVTIEDWGLDYDDKAFDYRWDSRDALLINRAVVRANPRKTGVAGTVVGRYTGALPEQWAPDEARVIWIPFTDPIVRDSSITPVAPTDFDAGFAISGYAEYSHAATFTLTAPSTGSNSTLTLLQVRATPYESQNQVVQITEDLLSQAVYGEHEHVLDNIYVQNYSRAQNVGQALVNRHRRAFTQPSIHRIGGSTDNWQSLAQRDIGDRVTLELPVRINGGFDADYYIDGLEHWISIATGGTFVIGQWDAEYRLRKALDAGQFLQIDGTGVVDIGLVAP